MDVDIPEPPPDAKVPEEVPGPLAKVAPKPAEAAKPASDAPATTDPKSPLQVPEQPVSEAKPKDSTLTQPLEINKAPPAKTAPPAKRGAASPAEPKPKTPRPRLSWGNCNLGGFDSGTKWRKHLASSSGSRL